MKSIIHVFDYAGRPTAAYDALAGARLADWWSTQVDADLKVGGNVDWTFEPGFNPVMRIETLEPGKLVEWRCIDGHEPWQDNTFHFQFESLDDATTRVRFRQEYAVELDDDAYGIYAFNWGYYLESLRLLVTTGEGKPYNPT